MKITRRKLAQSLATTPVVAMAMQAHTGVDGSLWHVARAQEGPVRIGSKDFTEQLILGEM
jgi:glycine betaine/choline ABC-type transport system substrate-binding protein